MPGEFFFLTFGGLGISLAGFAGLIFVLDRRPNSDNAISRWRIRNIAITGLFIAQAGLLVFPIFQLSGSTSTTVRIVSAFALIAGVATARSDLKPGPAWPSEQRRRVTVALSAVAALGWAVNVLLASVGLLMLLFVVWIAAPIGTFANSILELRIDEAPDAAPSNAEPPDAASSG